MNKHWYERPVLALFIFASITLLFAFMGRDIRVGESHDSRYIIYSIRFEYFGMDASEMERLITIPLEEKASILPDLFEIRSVSEYGKSLTTVYFNREANTKNTYLALRDAVDTLYNTLPQAVQKPRIYSSAAEQKAVLSIAVTGSQDLRVLRKYLDTQIKKELEGIDGVAEVIVAGGSIDEIRVEFDPERVIDGGINPEAFGNIIQDANVVSPAGTLYGNADEQNIVFDTKIKTLDEIRKLPVKLDEKITSMEYLAEISVLPRQKDEIVRINGQEGIAVLVKASFTGNTIKISRECKAVLAESVLPQNSYRVLYDNGEFVYKLIQNVLIAVLESFVCIIILIPFFFGSLRITVFLLLLLPVNTLWTIGQLAVLGYSLDQNTLSGISIALGLVVDAALVIADIARRKSTSAEFRRSVHTVLGAIIASGVTTVLVLVPLFFLDYIVPGIRNVVVTIGLMMCNSLILSCVFFPCFVFTGTPGIYIVSKSVLYKIKRTYTRISYRISLWSIGHKKICCGSYLLIIILTFVIFFVAGKNITLGVQDTVLYAVIEYEPEKSAAVIDAETADISGRMLEERGVKFIRTESRKGTIELEIGFDEKQTSRIELANRISMYEKQIPDGFLYIPESGAKTAKQMQQLEIAVVGDESLKCRQIAQETTAYIGRGGSVAQVVLNFKNPEKTIVFIPDRDTLAKNNISVETVASTLRWMLFGPVVDKWIQNGEETDIRVAGKGLQQTTLERISNLYIPTEKGSVRLQTLGVIKETEGTGKIYRQDGRRAAYFTVHMNSKSTDAAVDSVKSMLYAQPIEKGYGYLFARELELLKEQYHILLLAFITSIVGIVLLLTALTEDILKSVVITSIIPVSVSLPLLVKVLSGNPLEMGDIVGMVIVSGISVNNAIYIAESAKSRIAFCVREKIQSILVTSLTSIAGAVPLVLLKNSGFSGELSFFMIWGISGSVIASVLLFPAVISILRVIKEEGNKKIAKKGKACNNNAE